MEYALQLYSLRDDMAKNHRQTIKCVGEMGYTAVEFAGYFGETGESMRELLKQSGLRAVSSHVGIERLRDNAKEEIDFNHTVGNSNIILPYYDFSTLEKAKRGVEEIAKIKEVFVKEGFYFGYHNHDAEFKALDDNGTCAIDLLSEIDGLKFQPDVYWIKYAGCNPVEFIEKNKGRIISVHLKEYREDGFNVEFGNGILPWKDIMSKALASGTDLGIIEQEEYTTEPMQSVKICLDNFKRIFG